MFFRSKEDSSEPVEGPRFTTHDNGSLEIYSVENEDTGQYTCLAKNTEGSSAVDAMLYVKGKQFYLCLQQWIPEVETWLIQFYPWKIPLE